MFAYGTLAPGSDNPAGLAIECATPAELCGYELYDSGRGWPFASVAGASAAPGRAVRGLLLSVAGDDPDLDLAEADAYEGYSPEDPHGSLFVRAEVTVRLGSGTSAPAVAYLSSPERIRAGYPDAPIARLESGRWELAVQEASEP